MFTFGNYVTSPPICEGLWLPNKETKRRNVDDVSHLSLMKEIKIQIGGEGTIIEDI